jgi:hypothetical protein
VKENLVRSHVTELRGQADLGAKPKSVQPIRREVTRAREQTGENPVFEHVQELQWQASLKGESAPLQPIPEEQAAAERLAKPPPEVSPTTYPQRITPERIQEFLKRSPTLTEEDAKMLLALEDEIADIKRHGFRGFTS